MYSHFSLVASADHAAEAQRWSWMKM